MNETEQKMFKIMLSERRRFRNQGTQQEDLKEEECMFNFLVFNNKLLRNQSTSTVIFMSKNNVGVGVGEINAILDYLNKDQNEIFIITSNISTHAVRLINDCKNYTMSVLSTDDFIIQKTKNRLVPTYVLMSEERIKQLEKKMTTTRNNFPKILANHSIGKYLGFRVDEVVHNVDDNVYRLVI